MTTAIEMARPANGSGQSVDAPAVSLTKVMALLVPLMTVLSAFLTKKVREGDFSGGEVTTLMVAVVAFFAVTGAADVLARAYATAAESRGNTATFASAVRATLATKGIDREVKVLAMRGRRHPHLLCLDVDGTLTWVWATQVRILSSGA